MAAPPPVLKKNYRCSSSAPTFYTGGPVALSPDASFVACACSDQVKVVDIATGQVRSTLEGDTEPITAIAIAPDGTSLFAASRSRQVKLWNLVSSTCTRTWKAHEGPIADMTIHTSGGILATAGADRCVFVWDADRGYCTHAFRGHSGIVTSIMFHPDPDHLLLFSGGDDATVRVWDLVKKKCVSVLEKHFSTVTSLALSKTSNCLLSASRDKVVNIWSLKDFSLQSTIPVYEALEAIRTIPVDSQILRICGREELKKVERCKSVPLCFLTVGERGIIRLWLAEGGVCLYEQTYDAVTCISEREEEKRGFVDAALMPSADGIMCVTADQRLLFFSVEKSDKSDSNLQVSKRLIGYNEEVIDLRFIPGDENLLAVATNLEQIRIYDTMTMTCKQELFGHKDIVLCLDSCLFSQHTVLLASGGKDHMVRVWDVESGICLAVAEGHMAAVGAVAFSRKSKKFLVTGSSDRTIKVWSLEGFDESHPRSPKNLSSLSTVAAHDKDINSIAVAPNDSLLCTGSQDRTARIWKLPELVPGLVLRGHKRGVWSVQFSPVDQCVLTASGDKTIRLWALTDGSCLKTFEGHTASVLRAAFLSRGTQIISAGADGLLKLWTIKTNECINTFDNHEDKVWALDVNTYRNEMLASGGGDSVINVWLDCTKDDEDDTIRKQEEEILKDQELSNAMADTDYAKAVQLAFELNRPFKLLNVFSELFKNGQADQQLPNLLKKLDKEHLRLLLSYIREWNTKPRFCHVAQCVLSELFRSFSPQVFVQVTGIRELIEGILPYTERHFSRIDRLLRSTFLLDYTLSSMSILNPLGIEKPGSVEHSTERKRDNSKEISTVSSDLEVKVDASNLTEASHEKDNHVPIPSKPTKTKSEERKSTIATENGKTDTSLRNPLGMEKPGSDEHSAETESDVPLSSKSTKKTKSKKRKSTTENGKADTSLFNPLGMEKLGWDEHSAERKHENNKQVSTVSTDVEVDADASNLIEASREKDSDAPVTGEPTKTRSGKRKSTIVTEENDCATDTSPTPSKKKGNRKRALNI